MYIYMDIDVNTDLVTYKLTTVFKHQHKHQHGRVCHIYIDWVRHEQTCTVYLCI
jgi:hypothetical protein